MKNLKLKSNLVGFSFVIPSLTGFLLFMLYPVLYSLVISVMKWNMFKGFSHSSFVGLANYAEIFKNEYFLAGIKNNFVFTIIAVPLLLISSLILAVILNKEIHARGMLRTIYFMPYIATVTAVAVVFSVLFYPTLGPVNGVLRYMGFEDLPQWIASTKWALPTVALFWVWKNLGYCIVIYLAGLQGIPKTLYESASIDGYI